MGHRTQPPDHQPSPRDRVAALHRQAAADYAAAQQPGQQAAARLQLAQARAHGNEQAASR
ncbi:hypothetical protein ACL02U_09690 [Streptomyces sp. MS06]|uniref:hypothetical protein n=1 Tax=Streptomyces sp. MS06 TaxID=3385974 RepID=UPI0039A12D4D